MQSRIEKVRKILIQEKADALLVWNGEGSGQPATAWLSGFSGTSSALLFAREKILSMGEFATSFSRPPATSFRKGGIRIRAFLITDGRYTAQSKKEANGFKIFITSRERTATQILESLCKQYHLHRIVFDGSVTSYSAIEDITKAISAVNFLSRKRVLQELRMVKDTEEIRLLKKAGDITVRAFMRLLPELYSGMTEKEIAQRLEMLCIEEGSEGVAFPTIVASGKNGAFPHARVTDKEIKNGELVTIDFGVRYKGYVSDMTRTVGIGKIGSRLKRMYEAVRKAQELGCKKAKAGVTGGKIDAVCRNYLEKKGFGKYFTHSTGHGIGIEVHELPLVSFRQNTKMPVGAVITCEPGVYIPNVGGARIEDALVLTKRGNLKLTEGIPKELIVL